LKSQKDVAEFLDKVGGDFNAFTGEEYTGYYAKVNAEYLDIALNWVSDIFLNSRIPVQEIEKERGVIIEELHMYHDNPQMHIGQLWKEVFMEISQQVGILAEQKKQFPKLKDRTFLKYISSQYTSENTVVCVAGKINEKEIIEKVEKILPLNKKRQGQS